LDDFLSSQEEFLKGSLMSRVAAFWFAFGLLFFVYHPTETMAKKPEVERKRKKRQ